MKLKLYFKQTCLAHIFSLKGFTALKKTHLYILIASIFAKKALDCQFYNENMLLAGKLPIMLTEH